MIREEVAPNRAKRVRDLRVKGTIIVVGRGVGMMRREMVVLCLLLRNGIL